MPGLWRPTRDRPVIHVVSLFALLALFLACQRATADEPARRIVIAIGPNDGVFEAVGQALAAAYNAQPGIVATTAHSSDSQASADALEGGQVHLALEGARTSYRAYRRGTASQPAPHTSLRAVAVLFPTVVHIATHRHSGIRTVADLAGRRVFVGTRGSATEAASRVVLESHGLGFDDIEPVFDREGVIDRFRSGQLDSIFFFQPVEHALAVATLRAGGGMLLPLDPRFMEPIRSRDPLLRPAFIGKGTYEGQDETILTVGTDVLLVSRQDLPDDLVYVLTKVLFESTDALSRAHPSARHIDPTRGPDAPIPIHRGAARYYRERELFR
jgi:TRAP transporter TAXI family solute receptor